MSQKWTPESKLAKAVYLAGFDYDPDQDIIYSRMDAWQRSFGYCYAYDFAAPITISAIIDCEPFFFRHDDKDWMIELWKGQYGFETGAEIGVYVNRKNRPLLDSTIGHRPHDPANSLFFECADDSELLKMSFTLKRKGKPLFNRGPEYHWWLTGFEWGILSTPEDLTMDLSITFPSKKMQDAFAASVQKTGYRNIETDAESVKFTFDKPFTRQPRLDPSCELFVDAARKNNVQFVEAYKKLGLKNNDPNQIGDEFVSHFANYDPKRFKEHLITAAMQSTDQTVDRFEEGIEQLFKIESGLWRKFIDKLKSFFGKLFR